MRLPKPIIVALAGLILALGYAPASASAMLKKNAVTKHNKWQHDACSAGNRTCTDPLLLPTVCHGPLPGSTGPNVPSHTPQYACVGHFLMRTPINIFQNQGWSCIAFTDWSQYGNFIEGHIVCVRSTE
jgi:hypothetical protein